MASETYDAFISYRSTVRVQARRIKAALESLAQANNGDTPFRVFLDASSLVAGDLDEKIEAALAVSRTLVLVLGHDTVDSKWVNREIEFWLEHGGSVERLFIIRVDDVDLSWDRDANNWANPELLPRVLNNLFAEEQKYISLVKGVERTAVAPVFAAVRGRSLESLQLEEAARARRSQRTIILIAGAIGVLAVIAIIAGALAIISRNQAYSAAQEALGQADAAQSILAGQTDPVRAAQFALQAAQHSDSLAVRAAMLAAVGNSAHLIHTVDVTQGWNTFDATYSPDGEVIGILLQSASDYDRMRLEVRDVGTSDIIAAGDLPVSTAWVRMLSATSAVLCSFRTGSHLVMIDGDGLAFTDIEVQPDPGPVTGDGGPPTTYSSCDPAIPTADGILVSTINGNATNGKQLLDLVHASGYITPLVTTTDDLGVRVKIVAQDGRVLVFTGSAAQIVNTSSGESTTIGGDEVPASIDITDTDSRGGYFGQIGDHEWIFIKHSGDTFTATTVQEPETIWAVAPLVSGDGIFTGEVLTLDSGSVLTLSGTDKQLALGDDRSGNSENARAGWAQYVPTLRRLTESRYLAVFGSSVFVVDLDPSYPYPQGWGRAPVGDSSADAGRTDDWAIVDVGVSLQSAASVGEDPVVDICGGDALLSASPTGFEQAAFADGGRLLVRSDGSYRLLADKTTFGPDCSAVETVPAIAFRSTDSADDEVLLPSASANAKVIPGPSSQVAVLNGSTSVALFRGYAQSLAFHVEDNDGPWTIARSGAASIRQIDTGFEFGAADGTVTDVPFDNNDAWRAFAPDATALVASDSEQVPKLISAAGVQDLAKCTPADDPHWDAFTWLPADGYAQRASAARSATLVSEEYTGTSMIPGIDCATGKKWTGTGFADDAMAVTRYEVRPDGGVIETFDHSSEGGALVATHTVWSGDGTPVVRTYTTTDSVGDLVWSLDGDTVAATVGSTINVLAWVNGAWEQRVSLSYPGNARFSQEGLLIVTDISDAGNRFWVIDPTTGYTVLSGDLGDAGYLLRNTLPVTTIDGRIVVPLSAGTDKSASAVRDGKLTIPITIDSLRGILCDLNRIAICAGVRLPPANTLSGSLPVRSTGPHGLVPVVVPLPAGSVPAGWPQELAGEWCVSPDPATCFSVASLLKDWPDAVLESAGPSPDVVGATDYWICLVADPAPSCGMVASVFLRYFPVGVSWDCTATEVVEGGWPGCYPDYTSAHDPSKPRLVQLPNHQQDTAYVDVSPMYRK